MMRRPDSKVVTDFSSEFRITLFLMIVGQA